MPFAETDLNRLRNKDPSFSSISFPLDYDDMHSEIDGKVTIEDINKLAAAAEGNLFLISLNLKGRFIVSEGVVALIAEKLKLKQLSLRDCVLSKENGMALGSCKTLEELDIGRTNVHADAIIAIAQIPTLVYLAAEENGIGNTGAMALAEHPNLRFLNLFGNEIGNEGAAKLLSNKTLLALYLDYNPYDALDEQFAALRSRWKTGYFPDAHRNLAGFYVSFVVDVDLIVEKFKLTHLSLRNNIMLGKEGCIALGLCKALEELDIRRANLHDDAVAVIAKIPTLIYLDASLNGAGDATAKALAEHPNLRFLNLSHNEIGPEGAEKLLANKRLLALDLRYSRALQHDLYTPLKEKIEARTRHWKDGRIPEFGINPYSLFATIPEATSAAENNAVPKRGCSIS
jgi:Ran GTPase-activating protein (RanGAP) involved in mRNA processing and transport